ncbi:MAG: hypothetical protein M0Z41_05175 [Peptococcaceae bacterium]|jgi:hypothetical protein|nr:hypothetical protein [Peptococcaceae bacterium]
MFTELNELKGLIVNDISLYFGVEYVKELADKLPLACMVPQQEVRTWSSQVGSHCVLLPCEEQPDKLFSIQPFVKRGMLELGIQPYECAYLTTDSETIPEAIQLRVGTILSPNTAPPNHWVPDFLVGSKSELNDVISRDNMGYFAESLAVHTPSPVKGCGFSPRIPERMVGWPIEVIALGRYFTVEDQRSQKHALSRRIIDSKRTERQDALFGRMLESVVEYRMKQQKIDYVTRVPPRPGQPDRLLRFLNKMKADYIPLVKPEILECVTGYPSQKNMSAIERWQNVAGKFVSRSHLAGKHVVLFDDVMTVGATLGECSRALLSAGCSRVTAVVLGITQRRILPYADQFIHCQDANCKGRLVLRFRANDASAFWGCENWRHTGCKCSMPYIVGWRKLNELNTVDIYEDITDIEF